ncbi:hypothetical protein GF314_09915 [bacterium]|nr:hypothetical protein [bacterium]
MPWPWRPLLILLLLSTIPMPAASDGPPRRLDRVLPPRQVREVERDDERGAAALKPALPPITRPTVERPGLLEPTVMRHGLGRDALAAFQPHAPHAVQWELMVREVDGPVAQVFAGEGPPPVRIAWDGRMLDGNWAWSGVAYTYVFGSVDSTGAVTEMPGEPFTLAAYTRDGPRRATFLIPGDQLNGDPARGSVRAADPATTSAAGLDRVADRLRRRETSGTVRVEVLARDDEAALALADAVQTALAELLAGRGLTIEAYAGTASAAPPQGTVRITTDPAPDS